MIQLRNVPDSLHRQLRARAALAGMALSDSLIREVRKIAEYPTPEEMRERLAQRDPTKPKVNAMSTQIFAGSKHEDFLALAVKLALENVQNNRGRPFGAVLVKDRTIVATGVNTILASGDPTAHAELEAIRAAAHAQSSTRLDGHTVYASGHPCPMCLAAMYLTGIRQVYYAYSNEDGEPYGLSTREIYAELAKPLSAQSIQMQHLKLPGTGRELYEAWRQANQSDSTPR